MAITQQMTPFPTPVPTRNDPANFATRSDATLAHLEVFVPEANTVTDQINDTTDIINALEDSAGVYAQNALNNANNAATYANQSIAAKDLSVAASLTGTYKGNWSDTTTYAQAESVSYNSRIFISKINGNLNNIPEEGSNWALFGSGRIFIGRYI